MKKYDSSVSLEVAVYGAVRRDHPELVNSAWHNIYSCSSSVNCDEKIAAEALILTEQVLKEIV